MHHAAKASIPTLLMSASFAQEAQTLKSIHKVYMEKMPTDLDLYLRAQISKQFNGMLIVVLKKEDCHAHQREQKGPAAKITGRYLGLHDTVNGTISLLDKTESISFVT